jgi:hypothetical protein
MDDLIGEPCDGWRKQGMTETVLIIILWLHVGICIWFWMGFLGIRLPSGKIANILLILALPLIFSLLVFLLAIISAFLWTSWLQDHGYASLWHSRQPNRRASGGRYNFPARLPQPGHANHHRRPTDTRREVVSAMVCS